MFSSRETKFSNLSIQFVHIILRKNVISDIYIMQSSISAFDTLLNYRITLFSFLIQEAFVTRAIKDKINKPSC